MLAVLRQLQPHRLGSLRQTSSGSQGVWSSSGAPLLGWGSAGAAQNSGQSWLRGDALEVHSVELGGCCPLAPLGSDGNAELLTRAWLGFCRCWRGPAARSPLPGLQGQSVLLRFGSAREESSQQQLSP